MDYPRRPRVELGLVLFLCAVLARDAQGAGELEGQIRGQVVEAATNVPVPGATVTVSSPNLGDPRVVTTDENGEYEVPGLPLGHYRVTVSYAGVKPITREISVQPGVTSPLNIRWSAEIAEAETTVVTEERPLTNPDSTQTGTVLSTEQERNIPSGRSYTNIVRQVAGVTRNTGSRDHYIKGGRSRDNTYLIDGLDVTDPVSHGVQQRLAFESIEAVQVLTGGFDAEYNALGGVINTVTKEGSDDWRGLVLVEGENASINNRISQGDFSTERDRVFDDRPLEPTYQFHTTLALGGPIVKHRLWFNATIAYNYSHTGRRISPPLNLPHVSRTTIDYFPRLKVSWAPSSKQRLSLSLAADPQFDNNTNGGGGRLSVYETHTSQGGYNAIMTWTVFPSSAVEFRLDAGVKTQYINGGPQGYFGSVDTRFCDRFSPRNCTYEREAQTHVNSDDGSTWYNADTDYSVDNRTRLAIDPKLTVRGKWLGEHTAKIGVQFSFLRQRRRIHQTGLLKYLDQGGGPGEEGLCDPDHGKTAGCYQRNHSDDRDFFDRGYNPALFVQDKWRMLGWLTLTPGIRFDYSQSRLTDGRLFHSLFAVSPRFGLIADLTRDQKTILSTSYGRSTQVGDIGNASNYDDITQGAKVQERWNREKQQWEFVSKVGGEGGSRIGTNPSVPHADQITTSLRRELFRNAVGTIEHTWKKITNTWDSSTEINVMWDPTGYRVIGYRDGIPHEINLYSTTAESRNYQGISLSIEGRPTPNWYFTGFYTLSWLYGSAATRVPQQRLFTNGFFPEDQRHQFNVAASYSVHGFTVGTWVTYVSGRSGSKLFVNPGIADTNKNINRRSPRGTDPGTCAGNVPGEGSFNPATTVCGNSYGLISEYRAPARTQVDLHIAYDFYELLRQHISLTWDIFNVLNDRTPIDLRESDANNGNFILISNRNGALNMRFGARYDF